MKNSVWILVLLCFTCCQNKYSDDTNIELAIIKLCDRFSQLPKANGNQNDFYKVRRTILVGDPQIELQLRSTPDSIQDKQEIIIIKNPNGKISAIPLFSNTYRDYYNFEFDTLIPTIKKTNTSFQKEYMNAINELNLNDTLGKGNKLLYEILKSLLHCDNVMAIDSSVFDFCYVSNENLPEENYDSCLLRITKNIEAVEKYVHPSNYWYNHTAYFDVINKRIYTVQRLRSIQNKFNSDIKIYRMDCIRKPLPMIDL